MGDGRGQEREQDTFRFCSIRTFCSICALPYMRATVYIRKDELPCEPAFQRSERPQRGQTGSTAAEKGGGRENTGDSKQTHTSASDLGETALRRDV